MSAESQHDRLQVLKYYLSIGKRPKELGGGRDRGGGQLSGDSSCRMIDEQENTAGPRVPSAAEWPSLSRLEGDKTI